MSAPFCDTDVLTLRFLPLSSLFTPLQRPGLRKQQYENELFDEFKKSPQNPFNQLNVAYNASKEDKVEALQKGKEATARRLANS